MLLWSVKKKKPDTIKKKQVRTSYKQAIFLQCYTKNYPAVYKACKEAGINRDTYYRWMKEDPKFKAKVEETSEAMLDRLENVLYYKADVEQNMTAIIFILKTKGRERGYVERREVDFPEGVNVIFSNKFLPKGGKK